MALCFLFLLLQGVSVVIKQIYILAGKSQNQS
jgi:TRAP-type mannitol/chloroaromatic compound transport system permease small subunit